MEIGAGRVPESRSRQTWRVEICNFVAMSSAVYVADVGLPVSIVDGINFLSPLGMVAESPGSRQTNSTREFGKLGICPLLSKTVRWIDEEWLEMKGEGRCLESDGQFLRLLTRGVGKTGLTSVLPLSVFIDDFPNLFCCHA